MHFWDKPLTVFPQYHFETQILNLAINIKPENFKQWVPTQNWVTSMEQ